ncbi:conserved hypothetical protein [Vibrio chagasii]|nr:conserved hypothetical protein [Vibrio chagasii]CAH7310152.1 conserved hypothetical protein [Vibrio chagasii]CAH7429457.1 conserved hypothetical protein [Vibrio chagasii]CAH7446397.1 conserved hypothetical protein [Vibrio chagasii]
MIKTDSGGIGAKKGFLYQDYIAAYFTLQMLKDKSLMAVRCEVSDDIDLLYKGYIEYVQVKTTALSNKWNLNELTTVTKKVVAGKKNPVKNSDSILHKSIDCDNDVLPAKFKIVTPIDVNSTLKYLTIPLEDREDKDKRDSLLKSFRSKIKDYQSPNGKDVEYWLDNTHWLYIAHQEYIKSECKLMIIRSAFDDFRLQINPSRHPDMILNDLLVALIEKSATSIVLSSIDKKTYYREDFVRWFEEQLNHYSSDGVDFSKIYKQNEVPILSKFFESSEKFKNHDKEKLCLGFQGKYHLQRYTYEKIAKGIRKWLPEVLLRPRELADNTATNLEEKLSIYSREKYKNKGELLSLVPQVLLHSVIRTAYNSQPIPAHLHIDDDNNTTYTNVHIVINRHAPDVLVMGFNYFIRDLKEDSLNKIVSDFEDLLEQEAFDTKKDKIIEIKDDNYLLSHDIDDILDSNSSLDEHLDRFKFIFFIGFNSHNLDCHKSKMKSNFEDDLKIEIENRFIELIERLLLENEFYSNMNIEVCLYPVPRIDSLLDSVKSCLEA